MKQYIISTAVYHKKYSEHNAGLEEISEFLPPAVCRRMDSFSKMAFYSSKLAMERAGYDIKIDDGEDFGTAFTTYWGPFKATEDFFKELINNGPELISPSRFPQLVTNASMGLIAKFYKLKGPSAFLPGVCPLNYADMMLRSSNCNRMLITACDEFFENNYSACQALNMIDENGILKDTEDVAACSSISLILENKNDGEGVCLLSTNNMYISFEKDKELEILKLLERLIETCFAEIDKNEIERINILGRADDRLTNIQVKALKNIFGNHFNNVQVSKIKYNGNYGTETIASVVEAAEYLKTNRLNSKVLCLSSINNGCISASVVGGIYE